MDYIPLSTTICAGNRFPISISILDMNLQQLNKAWKPTTLLEERSETDHTRRDLDGTGSAQDNPILPKGKEPILSKQRNRMAVALACGNGPASGVVISLAELNGSGQSGIATLTASGGGTEVVLSLGEGTMKSKLVHIHDGLCGPTLGGVAHGLTDFADGRSVTMLEDVSLESLMTGDFPCYRVWVTVKLINDQVQSACYLSMDSYGRFAPLRSREATRLAGRTRGPLPK